MEAIVHPWPARALWRCEYNDVGIVVGADSVGVVGFPRGPSRQLPDMRCTSDANSFLNSLQDYSIVLQVKVSLFLTLGSARSAFLP